MRQRIDISEIEAQTKIRAKYLRALENEEWDLLPGPTFVKSFLRTYAEALGLDARAVVEEYKLRHERLSEHELLPIAPPGRQDRRRRGAGGPRSGVGRDVAVALLVVGLVALLIVLGNSSGGGSKPPVATTTTRTTPAKSSHGKTRHRQRTAPAPSVARLRLIPTGQVWVCLQAAGGRTLLDGQIIGPGDSLPVYRSKEFRMNFGNGNLTMRINGRTRTVPDVQNAIGYRVDRRGRRTVLSPAQRPLCR